MLKTINVTQEDINNGKPGEPSYCPIALAAQRVIPERVRVRTRIMNIGKYGETVVSLPIVAVEFVEDFDAHCKVQPFSFEITVP